MKHILSTMLALVLTVVGAAPLIISAQSASSSAALTIAAPSCIYIDSNLSFGMRDKTTNGNVINLQAFLYKYKFLTVEPTGYFGTLTLQAVKAYQAKYSISQTGYFGPLSRAQMKIVSCNDTNPTSKDVSVNITTDKSQYGPTDTIAITLTAKNNTNHDISYTSTNGCLTSYKIGEYNSLASMACIQTITTFTIPALGTKTWTMSHDLSQTPLSAGNYTIEGSLYGAGSGFASISVTGKEATVSVISPNGGETIKLGSTQEIKWSSYFPYPTFAAIQHTITLVRTYECTTQVCPAIAYAPLTIASGLVNSPYSWIVGRTTDGSTVYPGNYRVQICMSGSQTCDTSDSTFTITQ